VAKGWRRCQQLGRAKLAEAVASSSAGRGRTAIVRKGTLFRARQVACSIGRGSRRGGKGHVRIDGTKELFGIHPPIEALADEHPGLVLLVGCEGRVRGSTEFAHRVQSTAALTWSAVNCGDVRFVVVLAGLRWLVTRATRPLN
jgi:hypothetical protein